MGNIKFSSYVESSLFSSLIVAWYKENHRKLPWRETNDPYKIWLSEVILQQTRVAQGLAYYLRFVETYPTVNELANADEEAILRLWQGLGYYSRARNMHKTAQFIHNELNGSFPCSYKDLIKLKGVGPYTAAAIASLAFNEAVAVVDGNVYRVLSRFLGEQTDISHSGAYRVFFELAMSLLPKNDAALFNQAIMEFGAMQCVPQSPKCEICPLQLHCYAFKHSLQRSLPVKTKKTKVRERFFWYLVLRHENTFFLQKRNETDIWANLYDFYMIETDLATEFDAVPIPEILEITTITVAETIKHVLSHQRLFVSFAVVDLASTEGLGSENFYTLDEIIKLPKPILIDNFIQKNRLNLFEN